LWRTSERRAYDAQRRLIGVETDRIESTTTRFTQTITFEGDVPAGWALGHQAPSCLALGSPDVWSIVGSWPELQAFRADGRGVARVKGEPPHATTHTFEDGKVVSWEYVDNSVKRIARYAWKDGRVASLSCWVIVGMDDEAAVLADAPETKLDVVRDAAKAVVSISVSQLGTEPAIYAVERDSLGRVLSVTTRFVAGMQGMRVSYDAYGREVSRTVYSETAGSSSTTKTTYGCNAVPPKMPATKAPP
jgi:YD repeat-containing protein